ncbi:hypothetical protein E2C01_019993 [Portunus trituberculatus]|uniref:Uncharacterized protein n=1 Tax=Portunus trituberculatus TaxID=210409 RepID=A0A5B7DYQ3_PORTR|nr:hypothetical protein [Portunus trituberculatus]
MTPAPHKNTKTKRSKGAELQGEGVNQGEIGVKGIRASNTADAILSTTTDKLPCLVEQSYPAR